MLEMHIGISINTLILLAAIPNFTKDRYGKKKRKVNEIRKEFKFKLTR
jgi:competence protein ComGC